MVSRRRPRCLHLTLGVMALTSSPNTNPNPNHLIPRLTAITSSEDFDPAEDEGSASAESGKPSYPFRYSLTITKVRTYTRTRFRFPNTHSTRNNLLFTVLLYALMADSCVCL